jgi:hypothetical protein
MCFSMRRPLPRPLPSPVPYKNPITVKYMSSPCELKSEVKENPASPMSAGQLFERDEQDTRVSEAAQGAMDVLRDVRGHIVLWSPIDSDPAQDRAFYLQYVAKLNARLLARDREIAEARPAGVDSAEESPPDAPSPNPEPRRSATETDLISPVPDRITFLWDPHRVVDRPPSRIVPPKANSV